MAEYIFWVVWNFDEKTGGRPPKWRHTSEANACAEAERLARLNPGAEFHVLRCIGVASVPMIFRGFDDLPF